MYAAEVYEGIGRSLEEALRVAHSQIKFRPGRDFTVSRVIDWGMQFGGFARATVYYVKVIEDETASFKTHGGDERTGSITEALDAASEKPKRAGR